MSRRIGWKVYVACAALISIQTAASCQEKFSGQEKFPAFPTAEGAGAYTPGGRGGKVLFVTDLADYDSRKEKPIAGSFRHAIEQKGPRTILFRVSGNIDLKRDLSIREPFITIAGQSAPGGGICLTHFGLEIQTHDVILRYLRVRPGDLEKRECDAISCNGQNVIIDHCSTGWAIDEVLSTNGDSENVTVQWTLITESLNKSYHHKGAHGYGSLISGPGQITYHHNLYAYHRSRNPRPGNVRLDFRNNLVCAWGDRAGYCIDERVNMNYVANDLRPFAFSKSSEFAFLPGGTRPKLFLADNRLSGKELTGDNWPLVKVPNGVSDVDAKQRIQIATPWPSAEVTTESAAVASERILSEAGASLPVRDAVDMRVTNQIRQSAGQIINSQADVGGWPELVSAAPPSDQDQDGLPDDWERRYGLDPSQTADSKSDSDHDGYTDLEEFLNGTNPIERDIWIAPPTIMSEHGHDYVGKNRVQMQSSMNDGVIRYTLDGSLPTSTSTKYEHPIEIDRSLTVRACTFLDGQRSRVSNEELQKLTLLPSISSTSIEPGLRYDYYEKEKLRGLPDFSKLEVAHSGVEPVISFRPRKRDGGFGFRYTGFFKAPKDGVYHFSLRCSPTGVVRIHGQDVVENEGRRCEHTGAVALSAGLHPIEFVIFFEGVDDRTLEISVSGPEFNRRPLESGDLFHAASDQKL